MSNRPKKSTRTWRTQNLNVSFVAEDHELSVPWNTTFTTENPVLFVFCVIKKDLKNQAKES